MVKKGVIPLKATRICKICGKEYPFCRTERPKGTFIYQEVACCKEHAIEYFANIAASRNENKPEVEETPIASENTSDKTENENAAPDMAVIPEEDESADFLDDEDFYDDEDDFDEDDE